MLTSPVLTYTLHLLYVYILVKLRYLQRADISDIVLVDAALQMTSLSASGFSDAVAHPLDAWL